jgi:uncharacterized membrane protein YeiH
MAPLHCDTFDSIATSRLVSPKQWHRTVLVLWSQMPLRLKGVIGFACLSIGWLLQGADTFRSSVDLTGTVIFACTGTLCIIQGRKRLGLNGFLLAVICGFLTACGGGTLRTFIMGQTSVFWWNHPQYLGAIALGTLAIVWLGSQRARKGMQSWEVADHIALGVFVPLGVEHSLLHLTDVTLFMASICGIGIGVLTGVGGGVVRDVFLRRFPVAVSTPYAAVAFLGAALHMCLYAGMGMDRAWMLSSLIIALLANHWTSWQIWVRHVGMTR